MRSVRTSHARNFQDVWEWKSAHSRPQSPSFLGHVVLKLGALEVALAGCQKTSDLRSRCAEVTDITAHAHNRFLSLIAPLVKKFYFLSSLQRVAEIESQSKKVSCSMSCKCYLLSKRLSKRNNLRVIIKEDMKMKYIYWFHFSWLCIFVCLFPFEVSNDRISFCSWAFEYNLSQDNRRFMSKQIKINHLAVPNRVKNSTNFVQEKWQLTGGGW